MRAEDQQASASLAILIEEWSRATADMASRVAAASTSLQSGHKGQATKVIQALHQAKAFVELIASGRDVSVTLRMGRRNGTGGAR